MTNDEIVTLLEKNRAAIEKQDQLHAEMEKKSLAAGDEEALLFGKRPAAPSTNPHTARAN